MVKFYSVLLSVIYAGLVGVPRGFIGASIGAWERYVDAIRKLRYSARRYPEQNALNYMLLSLKYSSNTTNRSDLTSASTFWCHKSLTMCWYLFFLTIAYVLIWGYQLFICVAVGPYDTYVLSYDYCKRKLGVKDVSV